MSEDFPAQLAGFGVGSLLAGYRLEAKVGTGGMAVVFRARDQRLDRLVALKILAPGVAADRALRRRFLAESRAAAAVDHPHIIPIYEAGEASGVLFIAMRFVVGGDLRGVLEREGPLAPDRAAAFISPVASALDAAHRAGLVHRDVKPENILVDAREDRPDHVYLSDFGVSKRSAASVATGAGQYLGTVYYSAPEQIKGLAVDGRADQYALACVAYQLLTGSVPFERDDGIAVLFAHASDPPPSAVSRRPGLPGAADQVLARAMAKALEKRYGSCRHFADALREALGLPPYMPLGSTSVYMSLDSPSAPGHPRTEIAQQPEIAPQPETIPQTEAARSSNTTQDAAPSIGKAAAHADEGDRLRRQSRYADAETAYRTAIALDPRLLRAHSGLGHTLYELGQFHEAEDAFREAIRLDPACAAAHNNLGLLLLLRGTKRLPEAEAAFREAIRLDPTDAAAYLGLGRLMFSARRYPEAEDAFREAIRLDATHAAAYLGLGGLWQSAKRYPEAEDAFREAIRLDPALARAHNGLGAVLRDTGRYPEAEAAYREAIGLDPALARAHNGLGAVLRDTGRYPEAEAALREAIRLDPALALAHHNLGLALRATQRLREAEAAYREAIRLDPAFALAHYSLGLLLRDTKRYHEAEDAFEEAARLNPRYDAARNSLGASPQSGS